MLLFIPTLIAISLLAFGLSTCTPGDPVTMALRDSGRLEGDPAAYNRAYAQLAASLGFDKPVFYFSLTSAAYPDTLYSIVNRDRISCLRDLIAQYGNWPAIERYYHQIGRVQKILVPLKSSSDALQLLYLNAEEGVVEANLASIEAAVGQDSLLQARAGEAVGQLRWDYEQMKAGATPRKHWIPALHWYGFDNQYHHWLVRLLHGDMGHSYLNNQPVSDRLAYALRWTLLLNGIAIVLAYLIAVPLGVYSAVHRGKRRDRIITVTLFMLHSLPVFWVATLLLVFFTTPEYHMDIFPTMGLGNYTESDPFWVRFWEVGTHLVLPVFCLTYGALAFIARQMRGSMTEALQQDFVRTARAKGLPAHRVIWRHAFRNALSPIITMLGSVLPAAIAGSVVIEVIFNIPGMGKLTVDAIAYKDWPVVYAVLMMAAVVTMGGILLADILYAVTDPRVRYAARQSKG